MAANLSAGPQGRIIGLVDERFGAIVHRSYAPIALMASSLHAMDLGHVNVLAVIVATLAAFGLGALWYTVLFGQRWVKEIGMTEEQMKQGAHMGRIFGTCLVLTFVMGLGLAYIWHNEDPAALTWQVGLYHGLLIGLFFVAPSTGINYLYQRKSLALWLIDVGYQVVFLGIMGAIIGAWH